MALSTKDLNADYASMEHRHFANELRRTNPKFNRARFVAACRA